MKKTIKFLYIFSLIFFVMYFIFISCVDSPDGDDGDTSSGNPAFITTWKTDNPGTSGDDQITIPVFTGETYNYFVNWGDGNSDSDITGEITHTYASAGTYTVSITGTFPRMYFANSGDCEKILTIENWGDIKWSNMNWAFAGCSSLISNAEDTPDLSEVTDFSYMFFEASSFTGDLSDWNVNSALYMQYMFFRTSINSDLSGWDVSNVTSMIRMFYEVTSFNSDISSWNVGKVTSMNRMFYDASSFNSDLGDWDVSSVTDMGYMFYGASAFTNRDLSGWYPVNVTSHTDFDTGWGSGNTEPYWPEFVTTWKTDNAGSSANNQITIPTFTGETYDYTVDWGDGNSDSGVTGDITHTYSSAGTYTVTIMGTFPRIYFNYSGDCEKILTIENWGYTEWTSMNNAFSNCTNLTCNAEDTPDLSGVTDLEYMFSDASTFTGDLSSWDVGNVTSMNRMFNGASSFDSDLSGWEVGNVTDMDHMFCNASVFNSDLNKWDVNNVTNMRWMFTYAYSFEGNISSWDVNNVTDMSTMFGNASSFNGNIEGWVVSSVTDMSSMFFRASAFTNHDLSGWDVSSVVSHGDFSNNWGTGNTEPVWP